MSLDQGIVDTYIDRAVEEFDANPLSTQIIRRFADESPQLFAVAAVRQLATSKQSSAHNFLNILMLRQQRVLLDYITDPHEMETKRLHLFQRAAAIDHSFEVKLARRLPDRRGSNHDDAFRGPRAGRAFEVLDRTSDGRRLLGTLGHLIDSPDPLTREKAILFVGRRMQSAEWAEKQLKRGDERARANAVESIWGLDTGMAKTLFSLCIADWSNRVAGNALVGLHLTGQSRIADEVARMATDSRPQFRFTAMWIMGKIGDAGFEPRLIELFRDEQSRVRSAAMRALIGIWRIEADTPETIAEQVSQRITLAPESASELLALATEAMGKAPIAGRAPTRRKRLENPCRRP